MKKILASLAILSAALALPAVAADITIGAAFPMSGANAEYGQVFGGGVDLAVAHVNADKKLSGKLNVVYEDSQALPAQGVIAANQLMNVNKVPFMLSAFTGVSKAVAPIGARTNWLTGCSPTPTTGPPSRSPSAGSARESAAVAWTSQSPELTPTRPSTEFRSAPTALPTSMTAK